MMFGRQVALRCVGGVRSMRSLEMGRSSTLLRNTHNNSALSFSSPMDRPRMYGTATTLAKEERNTMTRWGAAAVVGGVLLAGAMSKQKVSAEEFFDFSPGSGEEMYNRVDNLYEHEKYDEAIVILQELIDLVPDNNDALWRLARALCGKAELCQSNSEKKQLLERAIQAGTLSLEVEETYESHKWLGASLFLAASCYWWPGWMSTMEVAKTHLEKAALREEDQYQSSSCQLETKLLWGKWNVEAGAGNSSFWHLMSWLSWSDVPKGDLDAALTSLLEVEGAMVQHNKFEMEATLYLVKTYLAMGERERAAFWLKQGLRRKRKRGRDVAVHEEMERMWV